MYFIFILLIVGFLVYAGGRETQYGGLGLLWRVAAWAAGIIIVFITIMMIKLS